MLLSLSGERGPAADAADRRTERRSPRSAARCWQTISRSTAAHGAGPVGLLLFDSKVVPGWAIRLFVLALIVPVLLATIDGLARARRRGHSIWRWLRGCSPAALPFALVRAGGRSARGWSGCSARAAGPGRRRGGAAARGRHRASLIVGALVVIGLAAGAASGRRSASPAGAGARARPEARGRRGAVAVLLVMCAGDDRDLARRTRSPPRCWCRRCTCGCGSSTPDLRLPTRCALGAAAGRPGAGRRWWSSTTRSRSASARSRSLWNARRCCSPAARREPARRARVERRARLRGQRRWRSPSRLRAGAAARAGCRSRSAARSPTPARARSAAPSRRFGAEPACATASCHRWRGDRSRRRCDG